jgi:hypothetical protein
MSWRDTRKGREQEQEWRGISWWNQEDTSVFLIVVNCFVASNAKTLLLGSVFAFMQVLLIFSKYT